jgi:hypothetical protein
MKANTKRNPDGFMSSENKPGPGATMELYRGGAGPSNMGALGTNYAEFLVMRDRHIDCVLDPALPGSLLSDGVCYQYCAVRLRRQCRRQSSDQVGL